MVECPWCTDTVEIVDNVCPNCRHEVLFDDEGDIRFEEIDPTMESAERESDIRQLIIDKFRCTKCSSDECEVDEVAMTGTGISKLLDIQYRHYLFVTCQFCGYVEVYNPNVLTGKKAGAVGSVLDVIFGG